MLVHMAGKEFQQSEKKKSLHINIFSSLSSAALEIDDYDR